MTAKLLQVLGAAFVVLLVGGAFAGFMVLKDRVKVVVSADDAAVGPDATSLLRDDVQVLTRDFGALQQALATNFEQLGNALEERAAGRHADVQALQQQVAALEQRLAASGRELQALRQQLGELPALVAATAPASVAPLATGNGQHLAATPAPPEVAPPVAVVPPPAAIATDPVPSQVEPAPKQKPKGGFLSFSVPTAAFRFDELQEFTIVPELSRVGFDAKSTLHDFTGVTSQIEGSFRADFDDPRGAWSGQVVVQAPSVKTGVDGRDTNMLDHLDVKNHPEITFTVSGFHPAAGGIDVTKQTARGDVKGTMRIRGQSREVLMPVTIEVDPQRRVVLAGQMPLLLSDYGVPVPSQLGVINMQDEVKVWIALRARLVAGGGK